MNDIIFKHSLLSAWGEPINEIKIFDCDKDNVEIGISNIVKDELEVDSHKYTVSYEDIETIKELLDNPVLYSKNKTLNAPVLDGSEHSLFYTNGELINKFTEFNLWYWNTEGAFDGEDDSDFTVELISLINSIQDILNKNNIEFNIIDEETDEEIEE